VRKSQCVTQNKKRGTWHFRWWEDGKRHSRQLGTIRELPTREAARKAAAPFMRQLDKTAVPLVRDLAVALTKHKADETDQPQHYSTELANASWFRNHIIPKWGDCLITDLQAKEVLAWLRTLQLAPKSKVHIRSLVGQLWTHAMFCRYVPHAPNPMALVTIKGASKRERKPRSLTTDQFRLFLQQLDEPVRTIALVCVCFGLRISECLALKWSDVDWLKAALSVKRGIVRQVVGTLKTEGSERTIPISTEMLGVLRAWKQSTQFSGDGDWVFASPVKFGSQPLSYPYMWLSFQDAAKRAGLGAFGTHTMRHTYRSWLDALGTPIAVQQKMMRHSDIRTTMNTYGDVVTDEMAQANSKVARLALVV
jgi:integrase